MKKPGANIIGITVMVFGILSLMGCGQKNDIGLRFKMEKMLTQADRLSDQIRQKNQKISDEDLKTLVDSYNAVSVQIAPPKDNSEAQQASKDRQQAWAISSLATSRIGILYMDHKMYDKAYDYFKVVANNPATSAFQKNAIINYLAFVLEKQHQYPEASAFYDSLAVNYLSLITPDNPNMDALDAPIKAADMWNKAGDNNKYQAGMDKAIKYYSELAGKYKGTLMEAAALGKMAADYIEQQKYPEAIEALKNVPPDSSNHTSPTVLLTIADIYMNNLKDYIMAEKTYREFSEYYPTHERIASANLGIGLSLFEQGKYQMARQAVDGIDKLPKADQKSVAQAYYLVGLCYEKEDKWELAKGQFNIVQAAFPGAEESFEAAIYVANHYRIAGNKEMTEQAFNDAVDYINKYVSQNNDNPVACARALGYLVRAYTENNDMTKAAEQLALLHDRYPQLPEGKLAPLRLADINENILHDLAKAVMWLKTFVNENPDANNINEIKLHIETLEAHLNISK